MTKSPDFSAHGDKSISVAELRLPALEVHQSAEHPLYSLLEFRTRRPTQME
jgi:hypothetical protein